MATDRRRLLSARMARYTSAAVAWISSPWRHPSLWPKRRGRSSAVILGILATLQIRYVRVHGENTHISAGGTSPGWPEGHYRLFPSQTRPNVSQPLVARKLTGSLPIFRDGALPGCGVRITALREFLFQRGLQVHRNRLPIRSLTARCYLLCAAASFSGFDFR